MDARSVFQVRISRDAERWTEVGEIDSPQVLQGLQQGVRYYVQMRQAHPEHGVGPWSFDWVWWRSGTEFEGRWSADGRGRTEAGRPGGAQAMFEWVAATHRPKARRVQIRARRARKGRDDAVSGWKTPDWLDDRLDFFPPGAGLGTLRRNAAYPPSAVTLWPRVGSVADWSGRSPGSIRSLPSESCSVILRSAHHGEAPSGRPGPGWRRSCQGPLPAGTEAVRRGAS